jgi:hypothetical protein
MKLEYAECAMNECNAEHSNAQMPAVVKQGKKFFIDTAERANGENYV